MALFSFLSGGRSQTANSRFALEQSIGSPVAGNSTEGTFDLASGTLARPDNPRNLVLIYAGVDNDLSKYMAELKKEVIAGASGTSGVVLMLLDGPENNDATLYRSNGNSKTEELRTDLENTGDADTLQKFLTESIQSYPKSESIILSLVGHGGGWSPNLLAGQPKGFGGQPNGSDSQLGGLLWDRHVGDSEKDGTSLSTFDLGHALQGAFDTTERRIDLLYLDACLMSMWEVAYEISPTVDYLLASQSWSWTSFQYEKHLKAVTQNATIEQIGTAWIENEKAFLDRRVKPPYTYSLLDLTKLEPLNESIELLGRALQARLSDSKATFVDVFASTDRFDSTQDTQFVIDGNDNYADIGNLVTQIETFFASNSTIVGATETVRTDLENVVIHSVFNSGILPPGRYPPNEWTWKAPSGLSIYFPVNLAADDWKRRHYHQLRLPDEHGWAEFIKAYWKDIDAPDAPPCGDPCELRGSALESGNTEVYLPVVTR